MPAQPTSQTSVFRTTLREPPTVRPVPPRFATRQSTKDTSDPRSTTPRPWPYSKARRSKRRCRTSAACRIGSEVKASVTASAACGTPFGG